MGSAGGMSAGFRIRAATSADANFAASMIYLSMDHLSDHLFEMPQDVIEKMVAKLFVRNAGRFGYRSTFIAEFENEPVGAMVVERGDQVNRLILETIPHLIAVLGFVRAVRFVWRAVTLPGGREAYDDEFFVSNLGVLPSMQGRSFGSQMLAYVEQLARENDLKKCSLIVSWHNTLAKRLYERIGYRVVETVPDENENLGYYRMVKAL